MKSVDKKMRATKPYARNSVALEKPLIQLSNRNYTVVSFYCNCFSGCSWASREFRLIK